MTEHDIKTALASSHLADLVTTSDHVENYSIDGRRPQIVVKPTSIEQVSSVMKTASDVGAAVAPWGGGTHMTLGNTIGRYDAAIDLSGLNRVIRHNYGDLTTTVEAGATLSDIQDTLKAHGQFLAIDAPLPDRATLGGTLAAGVSGALKWQYGSPRDLVIGMKVVQADGTITKSGGEVVKNVSGYDMARLHIGGLGTLGVIVELSLKLTPLPRRESTVIAAFGSVDDCFAASLGIFNSHLMPLALTSFDGEVKRISSVADSEGTHFLAIRLGGRPRTLERQVNEVASICRNHGGSPVETLSDSEANVMWRKIGDFGWDNAATPIINARVSVRPNAIAGLVKTLHVLGQNEGLKAAIVSHVGYGTVLVNWFGESSAASQASKTVVAHAFDAVHNAKGRMIIERCPLEVKEHIDVWDEVGDPLRTMRRMKEQYDPKGILNPGRYAGGI